MTTAWLAGCGRIGFGDAGNRDAGVLDAGAIGGAPPADAMVSVADAPPTGPIMQITTDSQNTMTSTCGGGTQTQTYNFRNTGNSDLVIQSGKFTGGFGTVKAVSFPMVISPGQVGRTHLETGEDQRANNCEGRD